MATACDGDHGDVLFWLNQTKQSYSATCGSDINMWHSALSASE